MTETKTKKRKSRPNTEKYQPLTKPLSDEGLDLVDYANRPVRSLSHSGRTLHLSKSERDGLVEQRKKIW